MLQAEWEHLQKAPFLFKAHILGPSPSQDSSHHQDYYIFSWGDPKQDLHFATASGKGFASQLIAGGGGIFTNGKIAGFFLRVLREFQVGRM